jgi:hypothetical protein
MDNVLFFHGETLEGRRFTVAGKPAEDHLILGIAICGTKDQFIKKVGRAKANGRLKASINSKGWKLIPIETDPTEAIKSFINFVKNFNALKVKDLQKQFNLYQK